MKSPKEKLIASSVKATGQSTVVSWGYVGPQPKVQTRAAMYHFPPGLVGVQAITFGDLGHVFLKTDGTLVCWDKSLGLGGRTLWHKHLEGINDVTKVIASRISPETLTPHVNMGGVFVWEKNGKCTFHYKHYESYTDYLSWNEDKTDFTDRFKKKDLGASVSAIILADSRQLFDIAIQSDGRLIPVDNSIRKNEETNALLDLVKQINTSNHARLANSVQGFSRTKQTWIDDTPKYGAYLVWLSQEGEIWRIESGQKEAGNISRLLSLPKIHSFESSNFSGPDDPDLFVALTDGKLKALNLSANTFTDLPKQASYDSIKERVKSVCRCSASISLALTESGRCFFVTALELTSFKPHFRKLFTKRYITPDDHRFSHITATINLNAITDEIIFLGLVDPLPPLPLNQLGTIKERSTIKAGPLAVWGNDSQSDSPIVITDFPKDLGPVLDATIFELFYIGLAAVQSDGSLFIMDPVRMDRGDILDSIPPWFPADLCSISADRGSGLIAMRSNGEILKWGPSEIRPGAALNIEELNHEIALNLPSKFKRAQKLQGRGLNSKESPDVVIAVL